MEQIYFSETINFAEIEAIANDWKKNSPKTGVLALLPEADRDHVGELQKLFLQMKIPLMGAIFPALLANDRFHIHGLILFDFHEMPFAALFPSLNKNPDKFKERIDEITEILKSRLEKDVESTLFMIFDAMVPNITTILDELYLTLADRVHYMGVNAGSESFKPMPCLFDHQNTIEDGVLIFLLKKHQGAILEHGYKNPSSMISATATQGNRIISIDWRPAFEVYQEYARAQFGLTINKTNFYEYAVHFPFGILRASNEILVRIPVALEEDGSLFCVGEVPPNSVLSLLNAPEVDLDKTVKTLANGLAAMGGDTQGKDILTFYCAGRRLHIGDKSIQELESLKRQTRANQIIGALSLGEIGSSIQGGYPLFHNATLVCSFWERK